MPVDAAELRVLLFGTVRISGPDGPIRLPTRHVTELVAYLLLHPGVHSRERVAALLWPDVPDCAARASLRNALAIVRRELGHRIVLADRSTVGLDPRHPIWVDALAFGEQASGYLEAPSADRRTIDLELYGGALLEDHYADWVLPLRQRYHALFLDVLCELAQQLRSASDYDGAIAVAARALDAEPCEERAHQQLMFCHAALGHRDAALRQYATCRRALRDQLDVEPAPATTRLYRWIRQAPAARVPIEASITNLPLPLTSFVGRQHETADVKRMLGSVRLLVLTGAGGSGKTRLAQQVAINVLDQFADGVWWVDLAALTDPELVSSAVARALGVPEVPTEATIDTVARFLRDRAPLLLLDNCEHVVAACAALVARLLGDCPRLTVLATSREDLGVAGERVWPVPPLQVPPADVTGERLLEFESVRLFVERATAARPGFDLADDNAAAVAGVCRRLEGNPLAIELAAARAGVLTATEIASRLDDALQLLAGGQRTAAPRHHTLREAIGWSHELLASDEQALFRRLSVFAGGWDLAAAEAVCGGGAVAAGDVLELLSQLVHKSLVTMIPVGDTARFQQLQTVQQFGRERLVAAGEAQAVGGRHVEYFLRLAGGAGAHLGYFMADPDAEQWLARLDADAANVLAALRRCAEDDAEPQLLAAGLQLAVAMHWYWFARGQFTDARRLLARLLDRARPVPDETYGPALVTAGFLACWQGDFAAARPPLDAALDRTADADDRRWLTFAQHGMGFVAMGSGDTAAGRAWFERARESAVDAGDAWLTAFASHFLAIALTYEGAYDAAAAHFEQGNELIERVGGHRQGVAFSLFHLARIARIGGDLPVAAARLRQAIECFRQVGDRRGIGYSLAGFAILAAAAGEAERAARIAGAVAALQLVLGPFLEAPLQAEYDEHVAAVRATLDAATYAAAWAAGQAMGIEQAIADASSSSTP